MRRKPGNLWHWSLFCLLLLHDELHPSFRSTLSETQLGSFLILLDWWIGKYQDRRLSAAAISYIVLGSVLKVPTDTSFLRIAAKISKSGYHYGMLKLFLLEFAVDSKPPVSSIFPENLPSARFTAATGACTQKIGAICYWEAAKGHHKGPLRPTEEPKEHSDVSEFGDSIALALMDLVSTTGIEINNIQNTFDIPLYAATVWPYKLGQDIDSAFPRPKFGGAVLEACPWLTAEEKDGVPYYLWDVVNEKTVETAELRSPSYTAISHTWGRWRLKDVAQVKGAKWPIPMNSLFSVEDLPNILKGVPRKSDYVWLDLVCIPQDRSDKAMAGIAEREIARQAKIFSTASHAVAWLNDVESFDSLESIGRWMALSLLEHPPKSFLDFHPLDEETRRVVGFSSTVLLKTPDQLLKEMVMQQSKTGVPLEEAGLKGDATDSYRIYHGWLSSLWTLQEACLRPDMWICSRDWTVLSLPDWGSGCELPLDGLIALATRTSLPRDATASDGTFSTTTETHIRQKAPHNVKSAVAVLFASGMIHLLKPTIKSILWLGDRRYCQKNRSEAIMSVIGVFNWDRNAKHDELVLGKYPLDFLEGVRQRCGANFFNSITSSDMVDPQDREAEGSASQAVGSILPIASQLRPEHLEIGHSDYADPLEHPSLASWKIQKNGNVKIREAAVIASSESLDWEPMPAIVLDFTSNMQTPVSDVDEIRKARVDLIQWIRSRPYECYAICISYLHELETDNRIIWSCIGVLLRKTSNSTTNSASDLGVPSASFINIGLFSITHEGIMQAGDITPSMKVDWVVL